MSTPQHELFKVLPKVDQENIQDEGYCPDAVMEVAEVHITNLTDQLKEAKTKYRGMKKAHKILEELRPHWAQGYTDDSMAAQAYLNVTIDLWKLLKVDSQTLAMQKLTDIITDQKRMLKVLIKLGKIVTASRHGPFTIIEGRHYTHGKNTLANDLYRILMEQDGE